MPRASRVTSHRHPNPTQVEFYEGLVHKTASLYVAYVEEEFEDIVSILRIKVWRALQSYDPSRSSMPPERYVFSCVKNQCKDLVKRKRRDELFLADLVEEGADFEVRYLQADASQVFSAIEEDDLTLPSTLSQREREIVGLLYLDFSQTEAAARLGLRRNEMERAVKVIRQKMADWRPTRVAETVAA
jgi:RNA polymerase sigma factor (sigma-70 family)